MQSQLSHIDQMGGVALDGFQRSVREQDVAERAAAVLEGALFNIFTYASLLAREVEDLDEVAEVWRHMEVVCDRFSEALSGLKDHCPGCNISHDRVLDLRAKCGRLMAMHA